MIDTVKPNGSALAPTGGSREIARAQAPQQWIFAPTNAREAMEIARFLAESSLVPDAYRGKPGDILIAAQMGSDVGLSIAQSLQSIGVINGKPGLYGDGFLGVLLAHPSVISMHETIEGEGNARVATCTMRRMRHGQVVETARTFSWQDAIDAKLAGKAGPWSQYPRRMLAMRARSWAGRDGAADVLKGLALYEEVADYDIAPTRVQNGAVTAAPAGGTKSAAIGARLAARAPQAQPAVDADPEIVQDAQPTPPALVPGSAEFFRRASMPDLDAYLKSEAFNLGLTDVHLDDVRSEVGGKLTRANAGTMLDAIFAKGREIAQASAALGGGEDGLFDGGAA